jgi:hypothetical protein
MNIDAYTEIEALIFQEEHSQALQKLIALETQATTSQDKLLILLRKIHIYRQTGEFGPLSKLLREILIVNGKTAEDWSEAVKSKLFEALLDSALVINDVNLFVETVTLLSASKDESRKALARAYAPLRPELAQTSQGPEPIQVQNDMSIEFKEIPNEVELLLRFTNQHFSMDGFLCAHDVAANSIKVSKPNGQTALDIPLKEQVSGFSWSSDPSTKGLKLTLKKGEPNKVWRGLTPNPGHSLPTFLTIKNTSDYMQENQQQISKKEKNWDKIVEEEEATDLKEKNYDCDPALHFFKQIYENADEDARRAMLKSFSESGGKALSTNWKEVKEKDYAKEVPDK